MAFILGCILRQHDLRLVGIAMVLCVLACSAAVTMTLRARAARGNMRAVWLVSAGMVAGAGIWATHFVSMLAFNAGLPIAFDPALTILSVLIAMVTCAAGFSLTIGRAGGAVGGVMTGVAISAMHYVGMAALRLPAEAVWNFHLVAASVLIGVSLSGLAGHLAMRRASFGHYGLAALLFSLAILGMHFTGMAAVRFIPDSEAAPPNAVLAPFALAVIVAACAAFIVVQAMIVAIADQYLADRAQGEALRMRKYILELEATKATLERTSTDLSTALDEAKAAHKAKSAFLASMSHELRTPLNAVIGFSEIILAETFGPLGAARYSEYLGDIHDSGMHLLSLVNDILDISRFDAGHGELQEEVFDPAQKIAETLRMIAPQAAKAKVSVTTDLAPGLPLLNADRRRMRQILLNLLSNALKFTLAGGEVCVRARATPEGLILSVSDNGIGMAEADIPTALEPFGQVDSALSRKHDGTGLGLPLTRQMAELHGGSLRLESAPQRGTTVTITLPAWRLVPRTVENVAAA